MAGFDDNGLTDLLYAASQDAPPSRVDLAAVLSDGRRRRHRRAVLTPLLAAACIVGLTAGGFAVASIRPTQPAPLPPGNTALSGEPTTTTPSPTTPVAPTQFPLDRQLFTLDGLGEPSALRLAAGAQCLSWYDGPTVWVFARGADDARRTVEEDYDLVDAPPVNSLASSYLYRDDGSGPVLQGISFQWAPGAWADIFAGGSTSDVELAGLAANLRTNLDESVLFWFTVSQPEGSRLVEVVPATVGEQARWSTLRLTLHDGPLPDVPDRDAPGIEVTVGEYFDGPVQMNATIGGRPARVSETDEYYSVELIENDGPIVRSVQVLVRGSARAQFDAGQAEALVLSVVVLGTWEDRSQWTDDPLR